MNTFTKNDEPISTDGCELIGNHWSCKMETKGCTIAQYRSYVPKIVHTPDYVFAVEIEDMTLIATTLSHYSLFKDGFNSASSVHNVPQSGQFLLKAPHNTIVQFGTRRFTGRHEEHEAIQINVEAKMPHFDHGETVYQQIKIDGHGMVVRAKRDVVTILVATSSTIRSAFTPIGLRVTLDYRRSVQTLAKMEKLKEMQ